MAEVLGLPVPKVKHHIASGFKVVVYPSQMFKCWFSMMDILFLESVHDVNDCAHISRANTVC